MISHASRIRLSLTIAICCALFPSLIARAAEPRQITTILSIEPLGPVSLGEHPTVVARLTDAAGQPIVDAPVALFLGDMRHRQARTDRSGRAAMPILRDLEAGTYKMSVVHSGSPQLKPASVVKDLVITPAVFEVRVVPPLAGVRFELDGREFSSDANGIARTSVEKAGVHRVTVLSNQKDQPTIRWQFSRWGPDIFLDGRDVRIPAERATDAGFDVTYLVTPAFVDLAGRPVDPERITSLTLQSSHGARYTFPNGRPQWLQANRLTRRLQGIEQIRISYSVESVIVDGSNVVNQSQQRFFVKPNDEWPIELLLYSARFTARDALFGFPIGSGVRLEYPSGHIEEIAFGKNAAITVRSLVRGSYRVSVAGVLGLASATPVALSRDQQVDLLVLSYLDIAVVAMLMAVLAIGLIYVGRPQLLNLRGAIRFLYLSLLARPLSIQSTAQAYSRAIAAWRTFDQMPADWADRRRIPSARDLAHTPTTLNPTLGNDQQSSASSQIEAQHQPHNRSPHRRRFDPMLLVAGMLMLVGALGVLAGLQISATPAIGQQADPAISPAASIAAIAPLLIWLGIGVSSGLAALIFSPRLVRAVRALIGGAPHRRGVHAAGGAKGLNHDRGLSMKVNHMVETRTTVDHLRQSLIQTSKRISSDIAGIRRRLAESALVKPSHTQLAAGSIGMQAPAGPRRSTAEPTALAAGASTKPDPLHTEPASDPLDLPAEPIELLLERTQAKHIERLQALRIEVGRHYSADSGVQADQNDDGS
jgi:hypothetical protein